MKRIRLIVILLVTALLALWGLRRCGGPSASRTKLPKVSFVLPENALVGRDYNQRIMIGVRNEGPGRAKLRLQASTLPGFASGFVGRGTEDWEVPDTVLDIPPGEVWEAPLLVHANQAKKNEYQISLRALHQQEVVGVAELVVQVATPKLEIETTWLEPENPLDRARLRRVLRLLNKGAPIADLSLHFERDGLMADHEIRSLPVVEMARLIESESLDVMIGPQLYPGFESLEGTLVIGGLNQEIRVAYKAAVPEGQSVFVTLSRTTGYSENNGNRCTNQKSSTYSMPPVSGTPASSFGGGSSGGTGGGRLGSSLAGGASPQVGAEKPSAENTTAGETDNKDQKDDDDGFGFLGIDPDPGAKEVAEESSESQDDEKKKDDKKKKDEVAEADDVVLPPDFSKIGGLELGRLNNGILGYMDSNARAGLCGTMELLTTGGGLSPFPDKKPPPDSEDDSKLPSFDFPDLPESPEDKGDDKKTTGKPDAGSVASRVDKGKPRTHMVRRPLKDGAQFIDFGFGIGGTVWRRNSSTVRGPISSPRLGPSPVKDGPALAAYTKKDKEGGTVAELLDPASGRAIELSARGKKADSPVTVENDGGIDAIHWEDGVLKRTRLGGDLSLTPSDGWPAGEKTGPILAAETRSDGKAALLTREGADTIVLRQPEGARELKGRSAALAFNGGDAFVALQGSDGSISVVDPASGQTRHSVPGSGYGKPSLMTLNNGGIRLSYPSPVAPAGDGGRDTSGGHFAVEYKDGKWGKPTRLFTPEAPVENAAVSVEFTPPFARAHYKPMDIGFDVNGRKIAEVKGRTPSGRYLYRVPVTSLDFQGGPPPDATASEGNNVTIRSRGIGPGNFHIAQKCALYSKHDWLQDCVVARDGEEADVLAKLGAGDVRHDAPDLVLASNGTELPRSLEPGEEVPVQIGVFNAGDQPSQPARLQALGNEDEIGGADIPSLAPFTGIQAIVKVRAPDGWRPGTPLKLSVSIPQEGDSDPATNRLDFYLFRERDEAIAGPERASAVDVAALPPGTVVEVPAATADAFYSGPLRAGVGWFRCAIPESGDLQIQITGPDAPLVDRIDLFDASGGALHPESDRWPVRGTHLYVRVGFPEGAGVSAATQLRLWWE
ncbi:MAG: hypothetical protein R3F13_09200 [Prosthecobacter sp.]